jgi:hypothetical protein
MQEVQVSTSFLRYYQMMAAVLFFAVTINSVMILIVLRSDQPEADLGLIVVWSVLIGALHAPLALFAKWSAKRERLILTDDGLIWRKPLQNPLEREWGQVRQVIVFTSRSGAPFAAKVKFEQGRLLNLRGLNELKGVVRTVEEKSGVAATKLVG